MSNTTTTNGTTYITIMEDQIYDETAAISEDGTNDDTSNNNNYENENENENDEDYGIVDKKKIALYEKWVTFFVQDGIVLKDCKLICTICNRQISADKKSRLSEHVNSKKHKKNVELPEDQRPSAVESFQPYTPPAKRLKTYGGGHQALRSTKGDGRDKSHEILLADTLNLFVQLDVGFDMLNSEVWQNFVKKHVKNGEHILKNFQIYAKPSTSK